MMRPAALEDVPALVELGRLMHAESPRWSRLPYSAERVSSTLRTLIESPDGLVLVADRSGKLVGGILGLMSWDWMSDQRTAQELALFMLPEYRGSITPCRLVAGLVAWAKIKGAQWIEAGVSTGVSVERTARLYEALGFERSAIVLENRNV